MSFRTVGPAGLAAMLLSGCMSWAPGWEQPLPVPATSAISTVDLDEANRRLDSAGNAEELEAAIDAYLVVLAEEPDSRPALAKLAEAQILYGAAYADSREAKARWFESGIQSAERAMWTNEAFQARVEAGESVAEACDALGRDEMRPMLFWVTGVSYVFKECLTSPGRAISFRWMTRTRRVMDRMMALEPDFERGAVLFSLAIYHIAAPPGVGRDLDLAAELFRRAAEAGPDSLLVPWGRAKYFHVKTGNRDAFRRDLEWVIAKDARTASSAYAWNVYFQRDARRMLDEIDHLFR